MESTDKTLIKTVVSVHPNIVNIPESWVWFNGSLYTENYKGYCPNIKKSFTRFNNVDYNEFIKTGAITGVVTNGDFDTLVIPSNCLVVIGENLIQHQVCFITSTLISINANEPDYNSSHTLRALVGECMNRFPTVKVTKKVLKAEVAEIANRALNKLTGFAIIISCLVILLTSYYNAYKIITGR